jgi:hypothetical protein
MYNNINHILENIKMMLLINAKDNSNYNNIIILFFITFLTFIINNENCYCKIEEILKNIFNYFIFFLPKRNTIILEGKICLKVSGYVTKTDNLFSNRFNAFWYYISKNNLNNPTIYSLKEYANSSNIYDDYGDPKCFKRNYNNENNIEDDNINDANNKDIFIVDQCSYFKINKEIFCKVIKKLFDRGDEKRQTQYEMENITIEIYSYKLSLKELENFLSIIDKNYQKSLEEYRNNKKFIYSLIGSCNDNNSYDREIKCCWEECEFISTRKFENLFFEHKYDLLNKLNFFINNKEFYQYEGHPYTFGLGLHGPPGTGKTSIIKCIANKLNRHIIVIPLSKIKTQREFSEYFFESYYTRNNVKKIDFKDKIIVFEDIDCMSNIVKKRNNDSNIINKNESSDNESNDSNDNNFEKNIMMQNKLLNKIAKKVDEEHVESCLIDIDKNKDDKITLSFILNIIDGIRETPGRILIITSNNYESLDPALIRPGRIDMTLEMKNATINTMKEMFYHYYKKEIPLNYLDKMKDYIVSPAKIINLRLQNENSEDFLKKLLLEF